MSETKHCYFCKYRETNKKGWQREDKEPCNTCKDFSNFKRRRQS